MHRDLYQALLAWKTSKNRKPLILRGARQVGKTHLLRRFAKQEYGSYLYLNFEEDPKIGTLFLEDLKPASILEKLSLYTNQDIKPNDTLIILDEIQESSAAFNSLKYFQEQASEFHIACAGSLLGVKLAQTKGFPVGKVNFLDLHPLSFFEFLLAIGKTKIHSFLLDIRTFETLPELIHEELVGLLKKYLYIGGMPEAVAEYVSTGNLLSIKKIQKEILDAYLLDFSKHAPKEQILRITQVWNSIPNQLAKENKKFIFSAIRKSARGREYESAIQWLVDAGLIYQSRLLSTPKLPLSGYFEESAFKIFLIDVGLLSAMSHVPPSSLVENNSLFSEFYGSFTENFVAQALSALDYPLYYWASAGIAEVDFIIEHALSLYPLEVKAGTSHKKKSLVVYGNKYQPKMLLRTTLMNLKKDGQIANIPLYLISRLTGFLGP